MNIFLSTPISCYKESKELLIYKNKILSLSKFLKTKHLVYSEIQNIEDQSDYDSPEKSIATDLNLIKNCDTFILHYPMRMPTSALIELGFAVAFDKQIIIITPDKELLPYLALGIPTFCSNSIIIESDITESLITEIMRYL